MHHLAFALRQAETGTAVAEVIRKMGISEQTFYRWKKLYAGMGVAELRRLKQLEEENRKLKQLVADPGQEHPLRVTDVEHAAQADRLAVGIGGYSFLFERGNI